MQIYGFPTMDAAARAFDLLTCKRAMEKGRGVQAVAGDAINVSCSPSCLGDWRCSVQGVVVGGLIDWLPCRDAWRNNRNWQRVLTLRRVCRTCRAERWHPCERQAAAAACPSVSSPLHMLVAPCVCVVAGHQPPWEGVPGCRAAGLSGWWVLACSTSRPALAVCSVHCALCTVTYATRHLPAESVSAASLLPVAASSRDDLIYGLKQCAKKGLALAPGCALGSTRWAQLDPFEGPCCLGNAGCVAGASSIDRGTMTAPRTRFLLPLQALAAS